MNRQRELAVVSVSLVALLILFFNRAVFTRGCFFIQDIIYQFHPFRAFAAETLWNGALPLWNPYIFGGFPSFAEGQGGFFYPLNMLLFYFLNPVAAYNYSVILNFFLAGLFMFVYVRNMGVGMFASLVSSVVFMFSGFFIAHLKHINMLNTACWIPLLFFLIEIFFTKKKLVFLLLAGAVFSLQVLAGHFQIAFYSAIAFSLYFLFRFFTSEGRKKISTFLKSMSLLALLFLAGLGIAAVQFVPTMELAKNSVRSGGITYEEATGWAYRPQDLITLVSPYYYGDPADATYDYKKTENNIFWENCSYVGLLPLFAALFALIFLWKNRYVKFFAGLAVFAMLVVLAKYTPLFKILWHVVPGFSFFRFPHRWLIFVEFSLAVLCGFALDYVLNDKIIRRVKVPFGLLVSGLVVFDLVRFGIGHNPLIEPGKWFSVPGTVEFLRSDAETCRIYSLGHFESWPVVYALAHGWKGDLTPYLRHREVLGENSNMVFRIPSAGGYTSFFSERFLRLEGSLSGKITYNRDWSVSISHDGARILGLMNVKYIIGLWKINSDYFTPVYREGFLPGMPDIRIYRNKEFVPRVLIVPRSEVVFSEREIVGRIRSKEFDPLSEVVIEKPSAHGSPSVKGSSAEIKKYSAEEVVLETNLTNDGFCVLNDSFYPGWKVFVDGRKGEILRANYLFRAVELGKGGHRVRFVYKPASFRLGALVSLFSVLALGLACLALKRKGMGL